ncbi:hypothetical protein [Gloeobacter morelensis]|uniref:Pyrroloquinoline quinone-dependent pyranose dehydrogenase beta-propeller domain-containing protein n=1 Tax=Gloeobacter morelensis MG652769 TaxID=2781736 RepID=A0ABY3PKE7_9CYAN|nr:hypothetical protein [Gloeobacter morelensis]UFP94145.1 hypothetical protein ISF26_20655 [Gloeobacter morelensis MG652769]
MMPDRLWARLSPGRASAVGAALGVATCLLMQVNGSAMPTVPGAVVRTKVQVPTSMRTDKFSVERYLNIPPNFDISVYARISKARFLAVAPNGDLLVSQPSTGKVLLVRPNGSGDPTIYDFASDLRKPHDIVFHQIGSTQYVYIAETHQINRYIYTSGDTTAQSRQAVVTDLPDSSLPELEGAYGHELKNMALDANNKLYVSIASTCNVCTSDTTSDPVRAAIYRYNADGTDGRLFAEGLRNAEGLAFVPGTANLWAVVNNRDNIAYPFDDSTGNYGKVVPAYVDNHPPEEFTRVVDGANYGWPFCNPNPDTANGYFNMPFDRDYEMNASGSVDCGAMDRIDRGIQAHSAPLGLTFLQSTNFASLYRNGAVVGLHGSWNRTQRTGYKVAHFAWDSSTQRPGAQVDLVTGWVDSATQEYWGRPVDTAVDAQGNLLISDDASGAIYKLTPKTGPVLSVVSDRPSYLQGEVMYTQAAVASSSAPSSVQFFVDGKAIWTEGVSPYWLGGDQNGGSVVPGYATRGLGVGSHSLSAKMTVKGVAYTSSAVQFEIVAPPAPQASVILDKVVYARGAKIYAQASVAASTQPASVQFYIDGKAVGSEKTAPYWLGGNQQNDANGYSTTNLTAGTHSLYAVVTVNGTQYTSATVNFQLL